jgi:transcriptional regulator of nitric oxide reductase
MFWAMPLLCFAAMNAPCFAIDSRLTEFIGQVPAAELVSGADHYGSPQGSPPVAKVFAKSRGEHFHDPEIDCDLRDLRQRLRLPGLAM